MKITWLYLALVVGTISPGIMADDENRSEIRQLIQDGKLLSLESIMQRFPENKYGRLLDLEVDKEHGRLVYEMEFLRPDGRVMEMEIDASNGQLLDQEIE